jgi:hypothetical protein
LADGIEAGSGDSIMKTKGAALMGAAGAALVLASATAASATVTTITFDDRISTAALETGDFSEGEYAFGNSGTFFGSPGDFQSWASNSPFNDDPGGATVGDRDAGTAGANIVTNSVTTIFSVLSVDVGDAFNGAFGNQTGSIVFGGLDIHGNPITTETFTLTGAPGLTTITLGSAFTNIAEFQWTGSAQIDNLVVNDARVTAGVPEPASWALMIAGFGLAGAALRQRKRLAMAA